MARLMALGTALLLLLLCLTGAASTGETVLTAACGPGCDPAPTGFTVPVPQSASHFRVVTLTPGRPCAGGVRTPVKGFSIRRGGQTVLVYYWTPGGLVSDPVPLDDLELGPGTYQLYAAPASGARVTLSFRITPRG